MIVDISEQLTPERRDGNSKKEKCGRKFQRREIWVAVLFFFFLGDV